MDFTEEDEVLDQLSDEEENSDLSDTEVSLLQIC